MEIKKFNNLSDKKLAKFIAKYFFNDLEEFDRVLANYDEHRNAYIFTICFNSIFKETIDAIDKFEKFMNFTKDGWNLQIDHFTYDDSPKAFYEFHLPEIGINKYLEKFQLLKNTNKYNL